MFRLLSMVLISILLNAPLLMAEQGKSGQSFSDWLRNLQKKIDNLVPKKELSTTNAVAGIRGAKDESRTELYWKGKKEEGSVSQEEKDAFKAAIDAAEKGDRENAMKQLERFMVQFPDSVLIPDAKKTLDMAKAERKEAGAAK